MMDRFRAFLLADSGDPRGQFVTRTVDDLDAGTVVVRIAFSGVVQSSEDSRFAAGDKVLAAGFDLGVAHDGGYAEYARVPAEWLVRLPPTMTLWQGMALGTAGFTAALAIMRMEQNGLAA